MTTEHTEEFYRRLRDYMSDRPQLRYGQAAFNLMARVRPDEAEAHRGGKLDPFYNDTLVHDFVCACLSS
jgi:hypothetical protein